MTRSEWIQSRRSNKLTFKALLYGLNMNEGINIKDEEVLEYLIHQIQGEYQISLIQTEAIENLDSYFALITITTKENQIIFT